MGDLLLTPRLGLLLCSNPRLGIVAAAVALGDGGPWADRGFAPEAGGLVDAEGRPRGNNASLLGPMGPGGSSDTLSLPPRLGLTTKVPQLLKPGVLTTTCRQRATVMSPANRRGDVETVANGRLIGSRDGPRHAGIGSQWYFLFLPAAGRLSKPPRVWPGRGGPSNLGCSI